MALGSRRTRAALAVGAVAVVTVAGVSFRWFQQVQPELASPGSVGARFVPVAEPETPYVVDGFGVCLSRGGEVRVSDVAFVTNQGGARVVDWGIRPQLSVRGTQPGAPSTLQERGGAGRDVVDRTCSDPQDASELVVEVRKSTDQLGLGMDLRITYESGPFTRELEVETDVVLCGPSDRVPTLARECDEIAAADPTVTATPTPTPSPTP